MSDKQKTLFAENISRMDAKQGWHIEIYRKTYLIQISDIGYKQPVAKYKDLFTNSLCLNFDDIEDEQDSNSITDEQAGMIAQFLERAKRDNASVIVHCHAGICRSGAVVEAAMSIGFNDVEGRNRIPNSLVKRKVMRYLGTYITPETSMFAEDFMKDPE